MSSADIGDPPPLSADDILTSAAPDEKPKRKRNVMKKFEGVLEFDKETQYQTEVFTVRKCSIKKLFSKAPWLIEPLKKMAKNMTAIASMTSRLLNFHVIRLIEDEKLCQDFKIDQSLVRTTVSFTLFVMGYKLEPKMDIKHPELFESAKQFKALLPQKFIEEERQWFNFEVSGLTSCFNNFTVQHLTSCLNHLYVNFEGRLGKLFHLRFDQQFPQMSKYKRRRYIGYMYRILLTDGDYVFRKKVDNEVLDFCNRIIDEVKSWFVFPQSSEAASSNAKRKDFISKELLEKQQSRLLSFYAWLIDELSTHEKKRFTLLPQCGLRTRNLMVDKTSATVLVKKYAPLKETKKKKGEDETMNETEEQTVSEATQNKKIVLTREDLLERMSNTNNKFPLCELLDLKCVGMAEREDRLWKPTSFLTDGTSVSITLQKPIIRNRKAEADGKSLKTKKTVVQRVAPLVGQIKLEEVSGLPVPLDQCRPYGNDPGRIRIASMVGRDGKPIVLTGKEYRFGNHVTRNNLKLQRLKDAAHMHLVEPLIKPSCTVSLTEYGEHVTSFFGQFSMLFDFYTRPAITRMKWDNYIMKQKFMDNWMNKHFGKKQDPQNPVIIAYGAASFSSTGKYQPSTPNKWFLDQLSRRYCVIMVDEYNTSQICSFCNHWEPMKPMTSHVKNEETGKTEKKEVRGIKHCSDSCLTTHDRDKNAATNILDIMLHHLQGRSRPTCFCPAQEEKAKKETKKRKKKQSIETEGEPPKKKTKKQKPTN